MLIFLTLFLKLFLSFSIFHLSVFPLHISWSFLFSPFCWHCFLSFLSIKLFNFLFQQFVCRLSLTIYPSSIGIFFFFILFLFSLHSLMPFTFQVLFPHVSNFCLSSFSCLHRPSSSCLLQLLPLLFFSSRPSLFNYVYFLYFTPPASSLSFPFWCLSYFRLYYFLVSGFFIFFFQPLRSFFFHIFPFIHCHIFVNFRVCFLYLFYFFILCIFHQALPFLFPSFPLAIRLTCFSPWHNSSLHGPFLDFTLPPCPLSVIHFCRILFPLWFSFCLNIFHFLCLLVVSRPFQPSWLLGVIRGRKEKEEILLKNEAGNGLVGGRGGRREVQGRGRER